jgi:hypothetical protein
VRMGRYGARLAVVSLSALAVVIAAVALLPTLASGKTDPAKVAVAKPAIYGVVKLDHPTVRVGGKVGGEIVFHNSTGKTRVLYSTCKANGLYAVTLHGKATDSTDSQAAFSLVGCSGTKVSAKPGITGYRFTTRAGYDACSQRKTAVSKRSKYWTPRCLGPLRDRMPALPAGSYRAEFEANGQFPKGIHVSAAKLTITAHKSTTVKR